MLGLGKEAVRSGQEGIAQRGLERLVDQDESFDKEEEPLTPSVGAQVRLLIEAPRKLEGRTGVLMMEVIDDEPDVSIWTPSTPEELAEFDRFLKAAERIDWSQPVRSSLGFLSPEVFERTYKPKHP